MFGCVRVNVEGSPKDVAEFFKEMGGNVCQSGPQDSYAQIYPSPQSTDVPLGDMSVSEDTMCRESLKEKLVSYGIEFTERTRTSTLKQLLADYEKSQEVPQDVDKTVNSMCDSDSLVTEVVKEESTNDDQFTKDTEDTTENDIINYIEPEVISDEAQQVSEYTYDVVQQELKLYYARLISNGAPKEEASAIVKQLISVFGGQEKVVDCDPSKYVELVYRAQNNWTPRSI